jgi:hypothetical protein
MTEIKDDKHKPQKSEAQLMYENATSNLQGRVTPSQKSHYVCAAQKAGFRKTWQWVIEVLDREAFKELPDWERKVALKDSD